MQYCAVALLDSLMPISILMAMVDHCVGNVKVHGCHTCLCATAHLTLNIIFFV